MAIEIVGAVYCPLSPQDPTQRLWTLVKETQTRCVLIDDWSRHKFDTDLYIVNIQETLNIENILIKNDLDRLSDIIVTSDSIAYVIFTSGSTGIPKAVS